MNNNFSKLGKQLLDIWSNLGVSQRISVAAATFVLLAGLSAVTMWSSHKDYGLLYGGLSDAEASKVVAALDDAKIPYKVSSGGSISIPSDKVYTMRMQLAVRRNLELYLSKKAQDMLEKVVGPGQAIVRVSAEVNYDSLTTSQDKFDPDGQVVRTQTKNDESTDTAATQNNVPTGITANTVTDTNSAAGAAPVNSSKNRKTTSTVEYEIGKTHTDMVQAAGGIKRLTAAITVATVMDGTGADRKAVPRSPEELDKLKRIVSNALGADLSRGDTVELDEMQFNDTFATDMTQQLDSQQKRDFWMTLLGNSAYPALALVALFIFYRAFKRTPVQDIPLGVPVGRIAHQTGNGNGRSNRPPEIVFEPQPGVVTVDVLNRLIRENPNNMTAAIRDWMHRGTKPE
jgi:flagellar M-ring protein FliF